jgi:hypothetical protein
MSPWGDAFEPFQNPGSDYTETDCSALKRSAALQTTTSGSVTLSLALTKCWVSASGQSPLLQYQAKIVNSNKLLSVTSLEIDCTQIQLWNQEIWNVQVSPQGVCSLPAARVAINPGGFYHLFGFLTTAAAAPDAIGIENVVYSSTVLDKNCVEGNPNPNH